MICHFTRCVAFAFGFVFALLIYVFKLSRLLPIMLMRLLSFVLEVLSAGTFGKARQGHSEKHDRAHVSTFAFALVFAEGSLV